MSTNENTLNQEENTFVDPELQQLADKLRAMVDLEKAGGPTMTAAQKRASVIAERVAALRKEINDALDDDEEGSVTVSIPSVFMTPKDVPTLEHPHLAPMVKAYRNAGYTVETKQSVSVIGYDMVVSWL